MAKIMNRGLGLFGLVTIFLLLMSSVTAATFSRTTPELSVLKTTYSFGGLGLRQPTSDIISALNKNQLSGLRGGSLETPLGSTIYTQHLLLADGDNLQNIAVNYAENNEENVGTFLLVDSEQPFMEWRLYLDTGLKGRIGRDGMIPQFSGLLLNIMGEKWTIFRARYDDPGLTLKLLQNPLSETLQEGETKVYSFDGVEYEITNIFVSDYTKEVKFLINGEITPTLHPGDIVTVANGRLRIAVDSVIPGREGKATFYLSGKTVEFQDRTLTGEYDGAVKINNQELDDVSMSISATVHGLTPESDERILVSPLRTVTLHSIGYRLTMDATIGSTAYIPEGGSLSQQMENPEAMLSDSWDLTYRGFTEEPDDDDVTFEPSGDGTYSMQFTNIYGETYEFPFLSNKRGHMRWGDDDDFVFSEPPRVANGVNGTRYRYEDVILLNKGTERAIRYVNHNTAERTIDFRIDGVLHRVAYNGTPGVNAVGTLVVDGLSYDVRVYEGNEITVSDSHLSGTIREKSYFLVSSEQYSAVFRYEGIDMFDKTITLRNVATDAMQTIAYQGEPGAGASGSFVSAGRSFNFWVHYDGSLSVDLNGDGYLNTSIMQVITKNGGILDLTSSNWEPTSSERMTLLVDVDEPNHLWEEYHWRIEAQPNNKIDLVAARDYEGPFAGGEVWNEFDLHDGPDWSNYTFGMTDYGVQIEYHDSRSCIEEGAAELILSIPHQRLKPNLVVTMRPFRMVPTPIVIDPVEIEPVKTSR